MYAVAMSRKPTMDIAEYHHAYRSILIMVDIEAR